MKFYDDAGIHAGDFTDEYFLKTQEILLRVGRGDRVTMQFFQKKDAILAGMTPCLEILAKYPEVEVRNLRDGEFIEPWEPVLQIEGPLGVFCHLETVLLGILSRATRVATNMRACVDAANGKPVLFMGGRHDLYLTQELDGYAAKIGGAQKTATRAGEGHVQAGFGTMPHALIAAFDGSTVNAAKAFKQVYPDEPLTVLVDFNNNCLSTALAVCDELQGDVYAVRLDTSGSMVDFGITYEMGDFDPRGVNEPLVKHVRKGLDAYGYKHVKIVVSGGFTPEKIERFEENRAPVDVYGVGSSITKGDFDFTADVVRPCAKVGRKYRHNPFLN